MNIDHTTPMRGDTVRWRAPGEKALSRILGNRSRARRADFGEGSKALRLMLVLSAMSPLFILWAVRGTTLVSQRLFIVICVGLFLFFNVGLLYILHGTRKDDNIRPLLVASSEDRRQDVISYLFAMLLPFYTADLNSGRNLLATLIAFSLVVLLFWALGLHYLNLWIVVLGYHCLYVTSPDNDKVRSSAASFTLITRKASLRSGTPIRAHAISSYVFVEVDAEEEDDEDESDV